MPLDAIPYVLLLGFFYGSTLVISRFSVGQFEPSTYIGLRLVMASVAHTAVYLWPTNQRPWPRNTQLLKHAIVLGVLGTAVPMTSIVTGLQYLSSGLAAILITLNPAVTVVLAHFFLGDERLTWRKSLGVALALSGAVLLAWRGESGLAGSENALFGYAILAVAVLFGAGGTVYARRYMREMDSFDVASIRMIAAACAVLPLSIGLVGFDLGHVTAVGYAGLTYAALVGTFSGFLLAFYNVKRFGATASAMTAYVIPVVTTVGGALFLGEVLTTGMLGGVVLIALGIAMLNRRATLPAV